MSPLPPRFPGRSAAREVVGAARQAGIRAAVEVATAGGARLARAADHAGPLLDQLDDTLLPATGDALEVVAGGAAATSRAVATRLLRLAVRVRLLSSPSPADGVPYATLGTGGGVAAASGPAGVMPVGRAMLERGARIAVLGLVAMIVLSTAAALLLPGVSGQPVVEPVTSGPPPGGGRAAAPPPAFTPSVTIGPFAGDSTAAYIGIADRELTQQAQAAPDAELLAVVDLSGFRSPQALHALLSDYRVTQVFFTVPGSGGVYQAAVRDPLADVLAAFDAQAAGAAGRAATTADAATRRRDQSEATALRAHCDCAFAAVIRTPAVRLIELRANPAVRVIDAAPPGAVESTVRFIPLAPDQQ
ncbi:hypothetical protein I6A60_02550 [Frankia sp. AgB1.9]|uniref:hypothetical protein n=1 Tax=unclassified Frankia TaxID=2632575 RepID=UPI0019332040|nr:MULTISPECIES: hypothetical protein [unclassified Frankia]MBL7490313.1 hypothetical protein [Frankia sp. AgW1.1]MBL7546766.1 hypothetical protein [Frankia sp. AgB1.9]MBL7623754.1 hypothetical protein [Frankia sp. AgB1.8]